MRITYNQLQLIKWFSRQPLIRSVCRLRYGAKHDKGAQYWEDASYEKKVELSVSILGKHVAMLEYLQDMNDVYLGRQHEKVFDCLNSLVAEGIVPPVDSKSRVLDAGCNVGAFLSILYEKYGCEVHGVDISSRAIDSARELLCDAGEKACFYCHDVLDPSLFEKMEDGYFSHTFVMSHLVHLPNDDAKSVYLDQLKRISRCMIVCERIPSEKDSPGSNPNMIDLSEAYGLHCFEKYTKRTYKYSKVVGMYYYVSDENHLNRS